MNILIFCEDAFLFLVKIIFNDAFRYTVADWWQTAELDAAVSKLTKFVEDIIVLPGMVDIIVDEEVSEEYLKTLESLSKQLKFPEVDSMVKPSKALKDVQSELEKASATEQSQGFELDEIMLVTTNGETFFQKVFEFIVQKYMP
ncbi:vacuolar protein sorting-associated protein 52 A-like [Dioscorea cayenensis subsp. rotundata]|uniref:Vacuolar protein sorting-associated protein 52 A-like n=1 Tax=Dioscorea cayennensis subsp. rotundata TaxID=55577 RepID=A0AB40C3X7_DIOCR|nr:vacuolar protein sorting-associated protein 52 A-like [Dioscorea cayenensis subsp. rotundata]